MLKINGDRNYTGFDAKVFLGRLPKNERMLMRKFAEKGFEFCRCWLNAGDDFHNLDATVFGLSPNKMRVRVLQTLRHLTGTAPIAGLRKLNAAAKK
jgi:hypothetical protein